MNGERDPNEVYADFRAAVLHILGTDMTSTLQPPQHGEWPAPSMEPGSLPPSIPASMPVIGGPPVPLQAPGGAGYPPVIWVIGKMMARRRGGGTGTTCQKGFCPQSSIPKCKNFFSRFLGIPIL